MSHDEAHRRLERGVVFIERAGKALLTLIIAVCTGVLWLARLEFKASQTADAVAELKPDVKELKLDTAHLKGRFLGDTTTPSDKPLVSSQATR